MRPGSSTESYPAFARIGLRENPGRNLNQLSDVLDSRKQLLGKIIVFVKFTPNPSGTQNMERIVRESKEYTRSEMYLSPIVRSSPIASLVPFMKLNYSSSNCPSILEYKHRFNIRRKFFAECDISRGFFMNCIKFALQLRNTSEKTQPGNQPKQESNPRQRAAPEQEVLSKQPRLKCASYTENGILNIARDPFSGRPGWRVDEAIVSTFLSRLISWLENSSVAQTTAAMTAIEPSSSFVPISLQRDVVDVHRSEEPIGINRSDAKRPDGLTLTPWSKGKSLFWDATCYNTFASSYLPKTSKLAGSAAASAVTIKRNKYLDLLDRYNFVVFAVESMGPRCSEAKLLTSDIGKYLSALNGDSRSTAFLRQRISIAIQRGNAISVMETFPESKSLEEIFYFV
ncbi:hypothetical protein ANN_17132 [Periplaneta americana]|uniref:Uncharacterized protein n=1 Tax=Periplaneta americana TaxID=6978 RepID=A0ABQ8STE2_PERAM|nr:hypothetical protein ANN_17132 [Periplaneta americana]